MHGGFLTMGHALFAPFFAPWIRDLALRNDAVVLSVDYRLLPTARGALDPLDDISDFWQWFRTRFAGVLAGLTANEDDSAATTPDFSRVLLTGGSAGGYLVLQTALSHPDEVSAAAMLYPLVDLRDDMFTRGPADGRPSVLGFPRDAMMSADEVVAWAARERESAEWKSRRGFEVTQFNVSATQCGKLYEEVFNPRDACAEGDVRIHPLEKIKGGARAAGKM
jgi:acetyl esterase/lipase